MNLKDIRVSKAISLFCIFAAMLCGAYAMAAGLPDPGEPGPYAVGHRTALLVDESRQSTILSYPVPRLIPVHIFYPADKTVITDSTPKASYPMDQIYLNFGQFVMSSDEWEQQGIDPAYQESPASGDGPFPLVTFSPGWGGAAWYYLYIGTRLASHGFVVAILYHYGDGGWFYEPRDNLAVAAMNRPLDVSFTITKLLERNAAEGDPLHNLINPEKIAASGHSIGGYAAMALASGDDSVCDLPMEIGYPDVPPSTCVPSPPDPRIRMILPLDGSTQFLRFNELSRINVPTLGIGQEWSTLAAQPGMESWQARLHAASQGNPAYRVDVAGVDHMKFSNICQALPIMLPRGLVNPSTYPQAVEAYCGGMTSPAEAHRLTTKYMVAFLKTNLSGDPGYQPVLTPGHALNSESLIEFFVTEKRNPHSIGDEEPGEFIYFPHQSGSEQAKALKDPEQTLPAWYFDLRME